MDHEASPTATRLGVLLARLVCRILGHRWHFLHAHPEAGKVYRCRRCGTESRFVR
ncbi:hypothetical protein [Thiobacter aerophilum]|uniref:hypothetical protein n=1 Tax=Thiobacter aerophilum TaxID=3121275 RepID=UPI003221D6DE